MRLLEEYVSRELRTIHKSNIRFRTIGRVHELESAVRKVLGQALERTADNSGMLLQVALNYSGRAELVDAFNRLMGDSARDARAIPVDEEAITGRLYTAGVPDPDLLIRTSGEMRISNFLSGRSLTPRSTSPQPSGRTSVADTSSRPSWSFRDGAAGTAASDDMLLRILSALVVPSFSSA